MKEQMSSISSQIRLAYLVSRYPAVSHTFILREVRQLRALGFEIHVASINSPDREAEHLTAEEREEAAATYYVKADGAAGALSAHLSTLASRPLAYLRGMMFALRLGGTCGEHGRARCDLQHEHATAGIFHEYLVGFLQNCPISLHP